MQVLNILRGRRNVRIYILLNEQIRDITVINICRIITLLLLSFMPIYMFLNLALPSKRHI
jgi:hypothetical protein